MLLNNYVRAIQEAFLGTAQIWPWDKNTEISSSLRPIVTQIHKTKIIVASQSDTSDSDSDKIDNSDY